GLTLAEGAVRPWQTPSFRECQVDMARAAKRRGIPMNEPWRVMSEEHRRWVLEGEGDGSKQWYGVRGFFNWLESKSYKMHIRVLLSKYRAYTECGTCHGARLKSESLWWRLHTQDRNGRDWHLGIHEIMTLPLVRCADFFASLADSDAAGDLLLTEIRSRLGCVLDVGWGYLTRDRQSRTLSGGAVQRINLTTARGTSLVNTLFVPHGT